MMKYKRFIPYILLALITVGGLFFRLKGISTNHSFWSDEAYVAAVARNFIISKISLMNALRLPGIQYQPLHFLIISLSLKLFGISEFSARLPTVIFSTVSIIIAFLLASRLSDEWGGVLAAFMMSCSQLILANATQAKPYIGLQCILLLVTYLILLLSKKTYDKSYYLIHILIIITLMVGTLLHISGMLIWLIYLSSLLFKNNKALKELFNKPQFIISLLVSILITLAFVSKTYVMANIIHPGNSQFIIGNNTTYLRELLWRNYAFITLPALFGMAVAYRKYKNIVCTVLYLSIILLLWNFRLHTHNIRYLVPLFGLIFVFFGVFWSEVGTQLFNKKSWAVCITVIILIFLGGYKVIRKPSTYYTPNADFFADIQIADYKTAFSDLKKKYPDLKEVAIFNDWHEAQLWYLPDKPVTAYFMKGNFSKKPEPHIYDHTMIYGSLNQFLKEKNKYRKGLLIVEDWESIMPEEIKQYAKKNMKREIRVEGLPQAAGDNWPIEIYSWGL